MDVVLYCKTDRLQKIKQLIELKADVNKYTKSYLSILGMAVAHNLDMESIIYLIKNGADLNSVGGYSETPLARAVYNNQLEYLKLYLIYGADPNLKSGNVTPAEEAKNQGNNNIADFINNHKNLKWLIEKKEYDFIEKALE